jgi:hypothetical protein
MNHLNATTQQTASASEELSATAEELSAQAQRLQELMAFFRLVQDGQQPRAGLQARATPGPTAGPARPPALRFGQARAAAPTQGIQADLEVDEASFTRF